MPITVGSGGSSPEQLPVPAERIVLKRDQRLVARITAPADEITLNGELF